MVWYKYAVHRKLVVNRLQAANNNWSLGIYQKCASGGESEVSMAKKFSRRNTQIETNHKSEVLP